MTGLEWGNLTRRIETTLYEYGVNSADGLSNDGTPTRDVRRAWRTASDARMAPPTEAWMVEEMALTGKTREEVLRPYATNPDMSHDVTNTGGGGGGGGSIEGLTYDDAGRLLEDTVYTYSWDDEGNLLAKQRKDGTLRWEFKYDHQNRLTQAKYIVSPPAGWEGSAYLGLPALPNELVTGTIDYAYDGLGRRVSRTSSFTLALEGVEMPRGWEGYSHDGGEAVMDLSAPGTVATRYLFSADGQRLARVDMSGGSELRRLFYLGDKDGAVMDLVDASGKAFVRVKKGASKSSDLWSAGAFQTGGWVLGRDLQWQGASFQPNWFIPMDRFLYPGSEEDWSTGLTLTARGWRDADLGRAVSEDNTGILGAGADGYRTPPAQPRNYRVVNNRKPRDLLDAATWFFAGAANTLTGGLHMRAMRGMGMRRLVGEGTSLFTWGGYAGQALNMGMSVLNPAAAAGMISVGQKAINAASSVGNALSMGEAARHGDYWGAVSYAAGSGLAWMRGVSPCAWASRAIGWGQRAMHAVSAASNIGSAMGKVASGDYIGALLDAAQAGLDARRYMQACFVAGTKLLTRRGWVPIEEIREGDEVWSKPEDEANHPGGWKRVKRTFRREGFVLQLTVQGRDIGTSSEHPFYVAGKGFVPAGAIEAGDLTQSRAGTFHRVEGVRETGVLSILYNLEVEDWHTYFVGDDGWGFDVWAHNAQCLHTLLGEAGITRLALDVRRRSNAPGSTGRHAQKWLKETYTLPNGERLSKGNRATILGIAKESGFNFEGVPGPRTVTMPAERLRQARTRVAVHAVIDGADFPELRSVAGGATRSTDGKIALITEKPIVGKTSARRPDETVQGRLSPALSNRLAASLTAAVRAEMGEGQHVGRVRVYGNTMKRSGEFVINVGPVKANGTPTAKEMEQIRSYRVRGITVIHVSYGRE